MIVRASSVRCIGHCSGGLLSVKGKKKKAARVEERETLNIKPKLSSSH